MKSNGYDVRYDEYARCECGQEFQLLDWACARHSLYHGGSLGAVPPVPPAERERIAANAASRGVEIRWS